MKKLLGIVVLVLFYNSDAFAERTYLICKEINKTKVDSYSFDNEYIYSGAAKYKIHSNSDTIYAIFENNSDIEWGIINLNRITGVLERAHGIVMPGENKKEIRIMKKNLLFEIFYNCKKTDKKI